MRSLLRIALGCIEFSFLPLDPSARLKVAVAAARFLLVACAALRTNQTTAQRDAATADPARLPPRHAGYQRIGRHVAGYDRSGTNEGISADFDTADNG